MTMHMESMKIGDELEVKGPIGHIQYKGKGYWMNGKEEVFSSKMIMIAGGTGITPMWQLIQGALQVPDDKTVFYVIYANQVCFWSHMDTTFKHSFELPHTLYNTVFLNLD